MRRLQLVEQGDLDAEPGSHPWAVAIRNKLLLLLSHAETTESNVSTYLDLFIQYEAYKQLEDESGRPFDSLEEFIKTRKPFGLDDNERIKLWARNARQRVEAAASETTGEVLPVGAPRGNVNALKDRVIASATTVETNGKFSHLNSTQFDRAKKNGISDRTQRKLDYLARNATDLLHKVQDGELSADRAYKMARGIKDPTPLDLLKKQWRKANHEEKIKFLEWVENNQ